MEILGQETINHLMKKPDYPFSSLSEIYDFSDDSSSLPILKVSKELDEEITRICHEHDAVFRDIFQYRFLAIVKELWRRHKKLFL
jgi:predicted component of type VI protein secretion system